MTTRRVTLTFDNGPWPGVTDRVLDILADKGVKAAFYVIASHLDRKPGRALAERAHAEGHLIGNHTLTHSFAFGDYPRTDPRREIEDAQRRIGVLASPEKLFRPFGSDGLIGPHLLTPAARDLLLAGGYTTVLWNSIPGDWRDPAGWVGRGVEQVMTRDWSVVVIHDQPQASAAGLADYIDRLNDLGIAWRQDYPDDVVLTRKGRIVSLTDAHMTA